MDATSRAARRRASDGHRRPPRRDGDDIDTAGQVIAQRRPGAGRQAAEQVDASIDGARHLLAVRRRRGVASAWLSPTRSGSSSISRRRPDLRHALPRIADGSVDGHPRFKVSEDHGRLARSHTACRARSYPETDVPEIGQTQYGARAQPCRPIPRRPTARLQYPQADAGDGTDGLVPHLP